jgi:hypothetical protein
MFKCWTAAYKTFPMKVAFSGMGRTQEWDMHWLREFALQNGKGGHQIPIMASLNGRFMRDSSPDEIVAKLCEWIDILGRDGRLLIFIGNAPADTPPLHIHTMVNAVRTLGKYPIAANLAAVKIPPVQFRPFDEWLKGQPEADIIFKAREKQPEQKVYA